LFLLLLSLRAHAHREEEEEQRSIRISKARSFGPIFPEEREKKERERKPHERVKKNPQRSERKINVVV